MLRCPEACVRAFWSPRFVRAIHAHRSHSLTLLAFLAHIRVVNNNQITGAGAGICAIKDLFYPDWCSLSANPDWTNGAMCPACLNTGNCKPPVTCTNTSF